MINKHIKSEIQDILEKMQKAKEYYVNVNKLDKTTVRESGKKSPQKLEKNEISRNYNESYTKALKIAKVFIPERLTDFQKLYSTHIQKGLIELDIEPKMFDFENEHSNSIQKVLNAIYEQQSIVESILGIIDSKLYNIECELRYNVFINELDGATYLLKKGFIRSAGVIAGVILESHLKLVCKNRSLTIRKNADISSLNEMLKKNDTVDTVIWRKIQNLADIRNYCAHEKDREPTKTEITDLIRGVKQIIADVF